MPMPQQRIETSDTAIVILAGGENRRMGRNKALLELGGKPLLSHLATFAQSLSAHVAVSVHTVHDVETDLPVLTDNSDQRCGPIAGVISGLEWLNRLPPSVNTLLTLPVDTPFVSPQILTELKQALKQPAQGCYANALGRSHYLCSLWTNAALAVIQEYLSKGGRSIYGAHQQLNSTEVHFAVATEQHTQTELQFFNINTPEDYAQAKELYRQ